MQTKIDEIAEGVFRLSTLIPEVAPPKGFTFNQFLVRAEEPLLFHCGMRALFPLVSEAVGKLIPLETLRWISFGHLEADESGSMNQWLAAAPKAQIAHGQTACDVSLNDLADRAPRTLQDGEALDLGGKQVRFVSTPHVPHGWDAGMMVEESTGTLFCSDLFSQAGNGPALTSGDILGPAFEAEDLFLGTSTGPVTAPTIRRLAGLAPKCLALMHGPAYRGDAPAALDALADFYAKRLDAALN